MRCVRSFVALLLSLHILLPWPAIAQNYLVDTRPGTLWISGTQLGAFEAPRMARDAVDPVLGTTSSAGLEVCFRDFNQASDYNIGSPTEFQGAQAAVDDAVPIPNITGLGTATAAPTASASNSAQNYSFGSLHIGLPATKSLFGRRTTGAQNELDSRLTYGVSSDSTGIIIYDAFCGWGTSTGTTVKEFGFTARIRRDQGTAANSCIWAGFGPWVLGTGAPLTTACALSATANDRHIGVRTDTSGNIHASIVEANLDQSTFDTGFDWPTSGTYVLLEMRGKVQNDGSGDWTGGYIDIFVNGQKAVRSGRSNTFVPSDLATNPLTLLTSPMSPGFATVRLNATGGAPLYQIDYIGEWHTRQLQGVTP